MSSGHLHKFTRMNENEQNTTYIAIIYVLINCIFILLHFRWYYDEFVLDVRLTNQNNIKCPAPENIAI